jgi:hypothetical protein
MRPGVPTWGRRSASRSGRRDGPSRPAALLAGLGLAGGTSARSRPGSVPLAWPSSTASLLTSTASSASWPTGSGPWLTPGATGEFSDDSSPAAACPAARSQE